MTDEEHLRLMNAAILKTVRDTAEHLARTFVTNEGARSIALRAIPQSLQNLDESVGSGNILMLTANGSAGWGTLRELPIRGTKELFKVIALREYDASGNLIAIGSETGETGRTLQPTWDWLRYSVVE